MTSNPPAKSAAVGYFVRTGARDETLDINGVSHFLEHMMFKGSARYTWEDVNRIFDEVGARNAAHQYVRSRNRTYYRELYRIAKAALEQDEIRRRLA